MREPSCKEYDGEELCIAASVYVDSIFHRQEKLCDYRYVRRSEKISAILYRCGERI